MFREIADVKPVNQSMPGDTIVFNIHQDLALATTPLDEVTDPAGTVLGPTKTVSVTLREYGNWTAITKALKTFTLDNNLNGNAANVLAFNMAESVNKLVENVMITCQNTIREAFNGTFTAVSFYDEETDTGTNPVTLEQVDSTIKARTIRTAVAKLRAAKVQPVDGKNYVCYIHPSVAADLMAETGADAWLAPHTYVDTSNIYAGEIGTFLGVRFIETPYASSQEVEVTILVDDDSDPETPDAEVEIYRTVYNTYIAGKEAIAEAVADEFHIESNGVIVDPLNRKDPLGWTGIAGWSLFRQPAMWIIQTVSNY
jgi:N4-gp56 family major capsid protein